MTAPGTSLRRAHPRGDLLSSVGVGECHRARVRPPQPLLARRAWRHDRRSAAARPSEEPAVRQCAHVDPVRRLRRRDCCECRGGARARRCGLCAGRAILASTTWNCAIASASDLDWPTKRPVRDLPQAARAHGGGQPAGNSAQAARDGPQGHRRGTARRSGSTGRERLYAAYSESVRNLGTPVFAARLLRESRSEAFGADCEVLTLCTRAKPLPAS